jgi:hypothetical protein
MITPFALQNLAEIMKLMEETELLIAALYETCADIWEKDRKFWIETAAEEKKHAKNIEKMARIIASRPEQFVLGRPFNMTALKTIRTGLEKEMVRVQNGRITREQMLYLARDVEASLIEKSYSEIVKTQNLEYLSLVKDIVTETARHKKNLDERIAQVKAGLI